MDYDLTSMLEIVFYCCLRRCTGSSDYVHPGQNMYGFIDRRVEDWMMVISNSLILHNCTTCYSGIIHFSQSGSGRHRFACCPLHIELCACIEGVKAAEALRVREIILETDASQVVEALMGDEFRLLVLGGVVHELKDQLAEYFILPLVKFVSRECNRVAHELASIGSMGMEGMPTVMAGVLACIDGFCV
jgi:hypothetical protein